jgi:hypothetical protein
MSKEPDWDSYFSRLSLNEFTSRSPFLAGRFTPTVYSEDGEWVYLSSLDVGVNIKDFSKLEYLLLDIESFYNSELKDYRSFYKLSMLETDMNLLKNLIDKLNSLKEE